MKEKFTAALILITLVVFVGGGFVKVVSAHEGHEHGGTEAHKITASDIKTAMREHIEKMQKKGDGIFKLKDKDRKNQKLSLKFVKIHDPVRKIEGKGYFACTDFQVAGGDRDQLMDIDFWLNPNKKGKLVVTDTRVHKDAVKNKKGKWVKEARYTFVNDKPVDLK